MLTGAGGLVHPVTSAVSAGNADIGYQFPAFSALTALVTGVGPEMLGQ